LKCVVCVIEAVEEEECWRQYEALRAGTEHKNTDTGDSVVIDFRGNRTKLLESAVMKRCDRQAHMDDTEEVKRRVYSGRDGEQSNSSTFWLRTFDAAESADPNRWFLTQAAFSVRFTQSQTCDNHLFITGGSSFSMGMPNFEYMLNRLLIPKTVGHFIFHYKKICYR